MKRVIILLLLSTATFAQSVSTDKIMKRYERRVKYRDGARQASAQLALVGATLGYVVYQETEVSVGDADLEFLERLIFNTIAVGVGAATTTNLAVREYRVRRYFNKHKQLILYVQSIN